MRCPECNHPTIDNALACPCCGRAASPAAEEPPRAEADVARHAVSASDGASAACPEAVCDCCGAPMRAGREMCEACERAFSSVLGVHGPPKGEPEHEPEPPPAPEPWWKAQRRQPPPVPPALPRASVAPPTPLAPASPAGAPVAVAAAPARAIAPSRLVARVEPGRVAPRRPRRVRPAFVAAAAVTGAILVGVPAGYESGLLPAGWLDTGPESPLPARHLAVSATGTAPAVAATATPASAAADHAALAAPTPASPSTRRSRRAAKPTASKGPAPVETPTAPPVDEPIPVSPIAETSVLTAAPPPVAAGRSEVVLAGPALEPSQVDVRPEVQSRVTPRLPGHLVGRSVEDVVVLRVLVLPTGQASDVRVLRASKVDASLDAAAIDAVRQWRFSPARKGGRPVSCWFSVGVPLRSE